MAEERTQFNNKIEYLLACIGFAVGLGNVWRFPRVCLDNGGGAFLIPYFVVFFLQGIPLMLIELTIGQRFRGSPLHSFGRASKYAWGIGASMAFASLYTSLYYNSVLSYGFIYFFNSFTNILPWTTCPQGATTCGLVGNKTDPATYYLKEIIQNKASNFEDDGGIQWPLYFATSVAWIIVFLIMLNGVKSIGKVVYFTALFPYVVLTILLVIGITQDGAIDGLKYLFNPDFNYVWRPKVWMNACEQIFFSASLAYGGLIAMSSHMPVRNNVLADTFVILCVNSFTSLYAALGVFSIKGHMAKNEFEACQVDPTCPNKTLSVFMENNSAGNGLVFVAMAQAVVKLGSGGSAIFLSIMFYLMIICLGVDSSIGMLEGYLSVLYDLFHSLNLKVNRKTAERLILTVSIIFSMIFALVFCGRHGDYWIGIFDKYGSVHNLVLIGFFEYIFVSHVYGMGKFCGDFHLMTGYKPNILLQILWGYISPIFLFCVAIAMVAVDFTEDKLFTYKDVNQKIQDFPYYVLAISLFLLLSGFLWIPLGTVLACFKSFNFGEPDGDVHKEVRYLKASSFSSVEQILFCHQFTHDLETFSSNQEPKVNSAYVVDTF